MIVITPRSQIVAKRLLQSPQPIVISKLAAELGVSPRTIRYDLEALNQWFRQQGARLLKKPRVGVWVECSQGDKAKLLSVLNRSGAAERVLDKHERVHLTLLALLRSNKPVALSTIAEQLCVSRSTIAKDLHDVTAIAESCNVKVVGKPRVGYKLLGLEQDRRTLIYLLLIDLIEESKWLQLLSFTLRSSAPSSSVAAPDSFEWFEKVNMTHVLTVGRIVHPTLKNTLTDSEFVTLVVHLAIALERIGSGERVILEQAQLEALRPTEAYSIAQGIAEEISKALNITIPEEEVGYITLHLLGQRKAEQRNQARRLKAEELLARVQLLVRDVQEKLGYQLSDDEELHRGVFQHLQRCSLRGHELERNPLMQRLLEQYPRLVEVVSQAAKLYLEVINLDENEIGYLCMHIRASLERRATPQTCRALVVCSTGEGSAVLLRARLARDIPGLEIVRTTSALNVLDAVEATKPELVISTITLPELGVPSVVVSPILAAAEAARVRTLMNNISARTDWSRQAVHINAWAFELASVLEGAQGLSERAVLIRDFLLHRMAVLPLDNAIQPDSVARGELFHFAEGLSKELGVAVSRETLVGLAIHLSIAIQRWRSRRFSKEPRDVVERWVGSKALTVVAKKLAALAIDYALVEPPLEEAIAVMRYFADERASLAASVDS